jgi:MFS family permease
MAVTATHGELSDAQHSAELRKAVIAATVGTTIEWYDFFIYGTAAGLIFPKLFFPNEDPLTGTLASFGTYFIGFVGRPIGAAVFGHYGDRIGRKATLIATLMLMGIATFLVAFVPSYASIGIWGAIILTLLRMLQGIGSAVNGVVPCRSRWNGREAYGSGAAHASVARSPACPQACSCRIW